MVAFPPCKINLGLHVLARRPDGYHDISTCFYPLPWTDILEILPSAKWEFHQSGINIPGEAESNLCVKAFRLLDQEFHLPPVHIHLHKVIPAGAGLGGGSSDGAHTLLILNLLFDLKLTPGQMATYALQLGSDCPFFIHGKPMMGAGRGEVLSPAGVDLHGLYLVLLVPEIHVSTGEAFKEVIPQFPGKRLLEQLKEPVSSWRAGLRNDFEQAVFRKHPAIGEIKEKLYSCGALYAGMSGSGSSVFGIFEKEIVAEGLFRGVSQVSYWL